MDKRQFLVAGSVGAILPARAGAATAPTRSGGALLTIVGALPHANRGPLDPVLDQLMVKHKVAFDKAWQFDAAALARLPAVTIEPTLEYDAKPHKLSGPLLAASDRRDRHCRERGSDLDLARARRLCGGRQPRRRESLPDDRRDRGRRRALGHRRTRAALGRVRRRPAPDFKDRSLQQRFALCPWGLYLIEVKSA